MKPVFKTSIEWDKANLLMQPILIRVIDNLRQVLETSQWKGTYEEIQEPYPGYYLHLTRENKEVIVDIWQLCFKICFLNYSASVFIENSQDSSEETEEIEIDERLIDETGEVDWQQLETKTKYQINYLFVSLP